MTDQLLNDRVDTRAVHYVNEHIVGGFEVFKALTRRIGEKGSEYAQSSAFVRLNVQLAHRLYWLL